MNAGGWRKWPAKKSRPQPPIEVRSLHRETHLFFCPQMSIIFSYTKRAQLLCMNTPHLSPVCVQNSSPDPATTTALTSTTTATTAESSSTLPQQAQHHPARLPVQVTRLLLFSVTRQSMSSQQRTLLNTQFLTGWHFRERSSGNSVQYRERTPCAALEQQRQRWRRTRPQLDSHRGHMPKRRR